MRGLTGFLSRLRIRRSERGLIQLDCFLLCLFFSISEFCRAVPRFSFTLRPIGFSALLRSCKRPSSIRTVASRILSCSAAVFLLSTNWESVRKSGLYYSFSYIIRQTSSTRSSPSSSFLAIRVSYKGSSSIFVSISFPRTLPRA